MGEIIHLIIYILYSRNIGGTGRRMMLTFTTIGNAGGRAQQKEEEMVYIYIHKESTW